jgi:O-antigen/teichoic acid export membrane protein
VGLLSGAVAGLLLVLSLFAGGPLIRLVMGEAFAPAAVVMTWQVAAAVIGIIGLPLEPMLISMGKPGRAVLVRLAASAGFLAALPFLTTRFGLIGAGAGLAAATGALVLGMLWFILRENGNRREEGPATETVQRLEDEV